MKILLYFILYVGDKSLRQILEDAKRIADCCTNPEDRDRILKSVSNLESMSQALNELRQQGKVINFSYRYITLCKFDISLDPKLLCKVSYYSVFPCRSTEALKILKILKLHLRSIGIKLKTTCSLPDLSLKHLNEVLHFWVILHIQNRYSGKTE
jgi:hypothetical protein